MEEEENENQEPEFQKEEVLPLPFPIFTIKKISKQALVIHKQGKASYQRGISQKAAVILSFATGFFLKHLSKEVMANYPEEYKSDFTFKRKIIASTLLRNPIYRFSMDRMKSSELFDSFRNDNEISRRISSHHIEERPSFPTPFVAPHPVSDKRHVIDEAKANKIEADISEAITKACVNVMRSYKQTIPSFFIPSKTH